MDTDWLVAHEWANDTFICPRCWENTANLTAVLPPDTKHDFLRYWLNRVYGALHSLHELGDGHTFFEVRAVTPEEGMAKLPEELLDRGRAWGLSNSTKS